MNRGSPWSKRLMKADHPRILLLLPPATYRADAFREAAERLNLAVTIGAEVTGWASMWRPPDFLPLPLDDRANAIRTVLEYAPQRPIQAVVGVDDGTAVLAAAVAQALGLPHNSVDAVSAARNKEVMRRRLRDHGVAVPDFSAWAIADDPNRISGQVPFPCVLKPLILSASCGVIRANDVAEFTAAFRRIISLLERLGLSNSNATDQTDEGGRRILVEEFVPGCEVAIEGLLTAGRLDVLAFFDKPDPLEGPYFEETIYVTPSRLPESIQEEVGRTIGLAAAALGLREGPVHGEVRINDRGVWVIELAARSIGGRCSRTLQFAAATSLEELILRHALRLPLPPLERTGAAGVMMLPIPRAGVLHGVSGEDRARAVSGIEEVTITAGIGQELVPLPDGTRYLGFLIARGASPEIVEQALREAHRHLTFLIREGSFDTAQMRPQVVRF
jgi:biotin carboxylase